jgi:cell division protein FtsB
MKEKEIASKQVDNQSMELEKLRKAHQQQLDELAEVKTEKNRISKEIDQALQDKEKAESAKRSYEVWKSNDIFFFSMKGALFWFLTFHVVT